MLGDLQDLNTREQVGKASAFLKGGDFVQFAVLPCTLSVFIDKVTKGVQLAREEAEDISPARLCV